MVKVRYESAVHVAQAKRFSKCRHVGQVFESMYYVSCLGQHLKATWTNNVPKVVDAVCGELALIQIHIHACIV